jgi:hypothetical protein
MGIIVVPIDEHRIAKGEETILLFDRFFVAMKVHFRPMKAETSITRVLLGKWKFVIKASTAL